MSIKKLSPLSLYLLVLVSSLVLGLSLGNTRLIMIAYGGATLGYFVADVSKLFRLRGVLANIVSLLILLIAMKDFFPGDSSGKLVSVANLLVYLQTVLMFQEKSTRLNWQILILSLLQVVVAAIFNFKFEAGLLFLLYFFVVTACLVIQCLHASMEQVQNGNRRSAEALKNSLGGLLSKSRASDSSSTAESGYRGDRPLTFFDSDSGEERSLLGTLANHLSFWIVVSIVFTTTMFAYIPRSARAWFGPATIKVEPAGLYRSINLDERGVVMQSAALLFRAEVLDSAGKSIDLEADPPYFRGMALSSLRIEDDKLTWSAPHDRVFSGLFQSPPYGTRTGNEAIQRITLEESDNPLVYGVMPFHRSDKNTNSGVLFCHEVSALTRCKTGESIELSQFSYEAITKLDENNRFSRFWPYYSNLRLYKERPMSDDPPQEAWLTQIPRGRFPGIVKVSNQLASENSKEEGTRLALMKKMERYFLEPGRYKYTLDFRSVERDDRIDPVEDFFSNHKSGHCELFASALTLMLRNQGIPARFVVGFHGAEKSPISDQYRVKAKMAHAWVEAYLPPEECTEGMLDRGLASKGGAWVILDATPPSALPDPSVGEEAYDLARTVWDDYVIGSDSETTTGTAEQQFAWLSFLNNPRFQIWERRMLGVQKFTNSNQFKFGLGGGAVLLMLVGWYRSRRAKMADEKHLKVSRLRRLFAGAISLISPGLGKWVMEGAADSQSTVFYYRMSQLLEPFGLSRRPAQTHREFASEVAAHFNDSEIQGHVDQITEWFNAIRFGQTQLDDDLKGTVDERLAQLKDALQTAEKQYKAADDIVLAN